MPSRSGSSSGVVRTPCGQRSGASATVFGAQGAASFLSRMTKWLAILFFITSGTLAYLSRGDQGAVVPSVMDESVIQEQTAPAGAAEDLPPIDVPAEEQQDTPTEEEESPPSDSGAN